MTVANLTDFQINKHPAIVTRRKNSLERECKKQEKKRTSFLNSLSKVKHKNQELKLYRELDKLEKKIKDLRDQKKNIETLGFILEGKNRRRPGRRIKKMFSKLRRTQEKIVYFRDYLFNVFQDKVGVLIALDFIDENLQLLSQAEICKYLYIQELFVTQLIVEGIIEEQDDLELNALLNCIGQAERRRDGRRKQIAHPFKRSL
ncbi:hypothetical protein ACFL27_24830, partial [candidate division CSSED10-310 bacterium]